MKHKIRIVFAITLVVLTLSAFVYYLIKHKFLITQLEHTPIYLLILLLVLYAVWFVSLMFILLLTILMCGKKLNVKDNFLVNGYSTLVNFFVPGQGGIALRGVYFNKIKQIKVKNYIFASLIYFMFYAVVSIVMLLVVSSPLWQTLLGILIVTVGSSVLIYVYKSRAKIKDSDLKFSFKILALLFAATALQSLIQAVIFGTELHNVNNSITISQVVTYTGAANFALFVALTPGAIGIRESFLLLTHKLHHISSSNIIAANIIDRAVFLVFLGILFLTTISFHAKYKNLLKKTDTTREIENTMHDSSVN